MYDKADIRIGFDKLKFRLTSQMKLPDHKVVIDRFVSDFTNRYDEKMIDPDKHFNWNQSERSFIFSKSNNCWFFVIDEQRRFIGTLKIFDRFTVFIDLFGTYQLTDGSIFELSDDHRLIMNILSENKEYSVSLDRIDISLDFYYDYTKSFALYGGVTKQNQFENIKDQNIRDISFLRAFPTHTIIVPIKYTKIVDYLNNNKNLKSFKNSDTGYKQYIMKTGMYYIWPEYTQCEKVEATHIRIRIKERSLFYDILGRIKARIGSDKIKVTYKSDHDSDNDIQIKIGNQILSIVKYNKSAYDESYKMLGKWDEINYHKEPLIKQYADNEDEEDQYDNEWGYTRVELRSGRPKNIFDQLNKDDVFRVTDLSHEPVYQQLKEEVIKDVEKTRVLILENHNDVAKYLKEFEKKKVTGSKKPKEPYLPKTYGRLLEVHDGDIDTQINRIKSIFIK